MKKLLVLLTMLNMVLSVSAAEQQAQVGTIQPKYDVQKMHRENAFERRLNLTEVQKLKATEIRRNGHEKIKPVIEEIYAKKQEAEMVRRSRMAVQMQEEKLTVIDAELKVLERKAQNIRKQNLKEFESILTWQQKKILKAMKKEGRVKYYQAHPMKPSKINNQQIKK